MLVIKNKWGEVIAEIEQDEYGCGHIDDWNAFMPDTITDCDEFTVEEER